MRRDSELLTIQNCATPATKQELERLIELQAIQQMADYNDSFPDEEEQKEWEEENCESADVAYR